jgi:hypothetical protein
VNRWSFRRRGAAVAVTVLAASILTSGCGPTGAGWRDPGLHEVAGIWVTGEDSCEPGAPDDLCPAVRDAVRTDARAAGATAVALARLPRHWVNERGEGILPITAAISQAVVAIVDLANGQRIVVGLICSPTITSEGQPPTPPFCSSYPSAIDPYRVGGRGFGP